MCCGLAEWMFDKSSWGDGPWQNEPDELRWPDEPTSLPCVILRNRHFGTLCGYVGIAPGHALFGWSHKDKIYLRQEFFEGKFHRDFGLIDAWCYAMSDDQKNGVIPLSLALHVHGGITWSGDLPRGLGNGHHWFGFDCGHVGDYSPGLPYAEDLDLDQEYRTIDFVKGECARLAWQLRGLEAEKSLVGAQ